MRPSLLYRVASVLLVLFGVAHQLGFRSVDPHWGVDSVIGALKTTQFQVQGMTRTYWDFFSGFGFFITVLLLFAAILAFQLARLSKDTLRSLGLVTWAFALAFVVIALITWRYIFPAPLAFASLVALRLLLLLGAPRGPEWKGATLMTTTLGSPSITTSKASAPVQIVALLSVVLLAVVPALALGQQPSPTPTRRDTAAAAQMQQMMGMFNQMGPMYETMMKSMIEGTLKALAESENVERMAAFTRRYYEALIKQGFTKDEALQIVAGVGVPALRMGK